MKYGSVCSGIEAATAAWHGLGWEPSFFSEIEKFPRAVLAHHYPHVPLHGDFTTIKGDQYEPIQLLVGGTPCQSFSVAGLRGGLDDDRGNLALEFLRLADRTRPRWLVWENVPGVLSSNGGRDFGSIIGGMVQLGYGIAYRILDAQYFGVAQRRRRVFVVGYLGDWRRAAAVLFERHSLQGHPAPRREAGQKPAPTISARPTGVGGLGTDFDLDGGLVARCVTTREGRRHDPSLETFITGTLCNNGKAAGSATQQDAVNGFLVPIIAGTMKSCASGGGQSNSADHAAAGYMIPVAVQSSQSGVRVHETHATLDANNGSRRHNGVVVPVAFAQNTRDEVREMPVIGALAAQPGMKQTSYVRTAMQVRRLTPRECERLQGFPDDYTLIPWRGKPAADGPRYKALGNSMAVPVMRWIGERIAQVEALS
jgi:DNA (cytosine-5)-methyltransferase 1